ncbi:DNA polymerase III subunit alpha ['Camptotheca acuminata' phytoplasma]|uniref:DNA polymerase III subunit alpha n=1 Tax='Camptotheca acuminata' phytoplasma TaxID=3239192 RepID=UPI00351A1BCB
MSYKLNNINLSLFSYKSDSKKKSNHYKADDILQSSQLVESEFSSFYNKFNLEHSTHYELNKVVVYDKKIIFCLEISITKEISDASYLEKFEQLSKEFLKEKAKKTIFNDLQVEVNFLFPLLDDFLEEDFWKKIFQYQLNQIIKKQNLLFGVSILVDKIDFAEKKCQITFDKKDFEASEKKIDFLSQIIEKFNKLLKEEYHLVLESPEISYRPIKIEQIIKEPIFENNGKKYLSFKDIPHVWEQLSENKIFETGFWIQGYIQQIKKTITKNNKILFSFYLLEPDEKNDSILYKTFYQPESEDYQKLEKDFQEGTKVEILTVLFNNTGYKKGDFHFRQKGLKEYKILSSENLYSERKDEYLGKKRIELHLHTKMSNLDSTNSAKEYIDAAARWGHEAIAFTDYNGIYAYPEINTFTQKNYIKPILGVEMDFIGENPIFVSNQEKHPEFSDFLLKQHNYVVFDIETTGFSITRDKIIEISAVKIENGKMTSKIFDELVNPKMKLNQKIIELTQIQNEDLADKPDIEEILPKFLKFIEGYVLVAHNFSFDIGFLKEKARELKLPLKEVPFIDTLALSQKFFSQYLKYFKLKNIAKVFKIKTDLISGNHHRALFDSKVTALVLIEMFDKLEKNENILHFYELKGPLDSKFERSHNVNILVRNQTGYKNLFYLISEALTDDFYKKPRLLRSKFEKYREGLFIGSSSYEGNVFEAALNKNDEELKNVISFYDYIEIQPPHSYKHIMYDVSEDNEEAGKKIIKETILKIIKEAQKQNKIVVATGDVHYLNNYDKIYREIYINAKLVGGGLHNLSKYNSKNLPDNYLLTTQEMLDAFDFIEDQKLKEDLVINNTHLLNDQIERIKIFPDKLFSLKDDTFDENLNITSIKTEIEELLQKKLRQSYGEKLHPFVQARIEKELQSIIGSKKQKKINNNIAPIYFLAHLLTKNSIDKGYPVGSRGSIGSSFVATLLEITEVNPLKPHYLCPNCQYNVFPQMSKTQIEDDSFQEYIKDRGKDYTDYSYLSNVFSGYDLPDMNCPFCSAKFSKNGQDIPFETFLGFKGDKIPDIDLNFAGDYQSKAHDYMKELLGESSVFRAGTIQTVATKTAFGYVKGFVKDKKIENQVRSFEVSRRSVMIEGVKRSTGQHPGGIVVVPRNHSIFDITPIQYPANDTSSSWKTTHFDYHSFENNLFKMDILGHDDPMLIKFFMDYVKQNPEKFPFDSYQNIPVDDLEVYKLFSNESTNFYENEITTIAIPEFGTEFVKKMLKDIYKKEKKDFNFSTLVKISGLSHGTDVWIQNAQHFLNDPKENISFDDIIGCRDDIMLYLIQKNVDPLIAFEIMELVRKGKQNTSVKEWNKKIALVKQTTDIPDWYFESLNKIKYLFPKAHAVAYVLMAVRIAWFKVYHPLLFYSGIFSKRLNQFDYYLMLGTHEEIDNKIQKLQTNDKTKKNTVQEQSLINTLNISSEMIKRGFKFLPIDLNKSEAFEFVIFEDKFLIMPFISIDGLGEIAANTIVEVRKLQEGQRFTKESFNHNISKKNIKLNKNVLNIIVNDLKLIDQLPSEI